MAHTLRLEYTCTDADMEQARALVLRNRLGGGSKWRTYFVLLVVGVGMLLGAWFRFREIPETYRALLLAAVAAGSVLFVFLQQKFRKSTREPTTLEISDADLTFHHADSKGVIPWASFGECLESPNLFVLLDRPKKTMYVVPKRAFPDEHAQSWFRDLAGNAACLAAPPGEVPLASARHVVGDRVMITVYPKYRDHLASTLASRRTHGISIAFACFVSVIAIQAAMHPAPGAAGSPAENLLYFVLPFCLNLALLVVFVFSVGKWWLDRRYPGPRTFGLSDGGVTLGAPDGSSAAPWSRFARYKETRWMFILWRGPFWIMLPKRAFESLDDVDRCRHLLQSHLQRSRWFLG